MKLQTLQERNDRYLRRVFKLNGESVTRTAKVLGIGRATCYRWLKKLGVNFEERVEQRMAELRRQAYLQQFEQPPRTL